MVDVVACQLRRRGFPRGRGLRVGSVLVANLDSEVLPGGPTRISAVLLSASYRRLAIWKWRECFNHVGFVHSACFQETVAEAMQKLIQMSGVAYMVLPEEV